MPGMRLARSKLFQAPAKAQQQRRKQDSDDKSGR
jgi:hypothetical protein